jgi:hypothetical protein
MPPDIQRFLRDKKANRYGTCKTCNTEVFWSGDRLESHFGKRGGCTLQGRQLYSRHKRGKPSGNQPSSGPSSPGTVAIRPAGPPSWVDKMSKVEEEESTAHLASFLYETAMPFAVVENRHFREFVKSLRPAYAPHLPSAKFLGGTLLKECYEDTKALVDTLLADAKSISIVTDGWSNSRNQHIVNFMALVDQHPPVLLKAFETTGTAQTGAAIAECIIEVILSLGEHRVASVVTDTASCMKKAWKLVEARFPHIYTNGCASHVLNLLAKDICKLEDFPVILQEATDIVNFIRKRSKLRQRLKELRKMMGIPRGLQLPVETRWCTQLACLKSVLEARMAIQLLSGDPVIRTLPADKQDTLAKYVAKPDTWTGLERMASALQEVSRLVTTFESNRARLSEVAAGFRLLQQELALHPNFESISPVLSERRKYIMVPSMGHAALLDVHSMLNDDLPVDDKMAFTLSLRKYLNIFFPVADEQAMVNRQLSDYLGIRQSISEADRVEYLRHSNLQFWNSWGKVRYSLLATVAQRLCAIPVSAASSERAWSIFAHVHSKSRNRLGNHKVEKLAYIYINSRAMTPAAKLDVAGTMLGEDEISEGDSLDGAFPLLEDSDQDVEGAEEEEESDV